MRRPRNRQELTDCIDTLKKTITAFDRQNAQKMLFFNDLCYYEHLRGFSLPPGRRRGKSASAEELLNRLEPYIPLPLTEENFHLFLRAAEEMSQVHDDLPDYFAHKAKIDFITTVRNADSPERQEWIINVCDAIREIKIELADARASL